MAFECRDMHNEPRRLQNQQQQRAAVHSRTDSPLSDKNGRDRRVGSPKAGEDRHHTGSAATSRGHSSRKREPETRLRQSNSHRDMSDSTRGSEQYSRKAASKDLRHSAGHSRPSRDERRDRQEGHSSRHRDSQQGHGSRHRARLSSRESAEVREEEPLPPPPPVRAEEPLPPPPPLPSPLPLPPPPPLPMRDPALDFFSADFNALIALTTLGLRPPNPNVAPLDTVDRCRFILPAEMEESLAGTSLSRPSKVKATNP